MNILVILEDSRGVLHRMSKEAIVGAQSISGDITAVIIGENSRKISSEVKDYNISKVLTINNVIVNSYSADGYLAVLEKVIDYIKPKLILCGHSYQTRDFMPRISAKLNLPFIPDVISVENSNYVKQVVNSKLNATIISDSDCSILSFQSASFSEDNLELGSAVVENFDISLDNRIIRSKSEEPFQESKGDIDLESADLIVSVGRGIEKEENIPIAFDLAKVLGAEVSASRPVVDAGWMPSFRQVGSSGASIAPKLYFSLGISGAIQHVVGMKGSKNILAINKDPDSPIFEIADYAVIGDVLEIVPKLTESLKQ